MMSPSVNVRPAQLLDQAPNTETPELDLTGIDPRSIKKLKDILSLSPEDRNDLYRILNKMVRKKQLEEREHAR